MIDTKAPFPSYARWWVLVLNPTSFNARSRGIALLLATNFQFPKSTIS